MPPAIPEKTALNAKASTLFKVRINAKYGRRGFVAADCPHGISSAASQQHDNACHGNRQHRSHHIKQVERKCVRLHIRNLQPNSLAAACPIQISDHFSHSKIDPERGDREVVTSQSKQRNSCQHGENGRTRIPATGSVTRKGTSIGSIRTAVVYAPIPGREHDISERKITADPRDDIPAARKHSNHEHLGKDAQPVAVRYCGMTRTANRPPARASIRNSLLRPCPAGTAGPLRPCALSWSVTDRDLREEALTQNALWSEDEHREQHRHADADLITWPDHIGAGKFDHPSRISNT